MTREKTLALIAACVLAASRASAWTITETPLGSAGSHPNFIIIGPDGNMWFTEYGTSKIGVVDSKTGGLLSEFPTQTNSCGPVGLTLARDGNVWYTCTLVPAIGRINTAGIAKEYGTNGALSGPIVAGNDGNLYFTRTDGHLDVADLTGASLGSIAVSASVFGLSSGGDGYIWVASAGDNMLWRLIYEGPGAWTYAGVSTGSKSPYVVAWCQSFGGVYFAGYSPDGFWGSWAYGDASAFTTSTGAGSSPHGIICAPDADAWYAASGGNFIADRFYGTEYSPKTGSSYPYQMAFGPDGSLWFTENGVGKIGRLRLHPPGDVNGSGDVDVADVFYLINFLFAGGPAPI